MNDSTGPKGIFPRGPLAVDRKKFLHQNFDIMKNLIGSTVIPKLAFLLSHDDKGLLVEFSEAARRFAPEWSHWVISHTPDFIFQLRHSLAEGIIDRGIAGDIEQEMFRSFGRNSETWDLGPIILMAFGHDNSRHFLDFIIEGGGFDEEKEIIRAA